MYKNDGPDMTFFIYEVSCKKYPIFRQCYTGGNDMLSHRSFHVWQELDLSVMKTPEHSRTSRIPLMHSPFAQKSFCHDGLKHTHIHRSTGLAMRVLTDKHTQTETHTARRLRFYDLDR